MNDVPLPLGYAEQPNPPPRPSLRDPAVRRAAAESLLVDDVIDWLGNDWREACREGVIKDLMEVVCEHDGYAAARKLESKRWSCDAALVEILDSAWTYHAEREAVLAWVEANKITPKFELGAVVKTRHGIGPIVAICADEATYTVQTDEFLAKNPGQTGKTSGYVIAFEACEALP